MCDRRDYATLPTIVRILVIRLFDVLSGQVYRCEQRQKSIPLERVLGRPDGHRFRVVRVADDRRPRVFEVSSWKLL